MTAFDLHPDALLDRAARGVASPEEQRLVDAHLAECAACRLEVMARRDFASLPADPADVEDVVARALAGLSTGAAAPRASRRRVGPLLAAAIALGSLGSLAAVARATGVLPRVVAALVAPRTPTLLPAPSTRGPRGNSATPAEIGVPPETGAPPAAESVASPVAEVLPATPPAPLRPRARAPVAHVAVAPPPPVEETSATTPPPPPSALELFVSANEARIAGRQDVAVEGYRAVLARYPASAEAALTRAALGRLLLDRGDAAAALEVLDAYLASGDAAVREEALGARALALQRLGRDADEVAAWRVLLEEAPDSVFAPRARARVEAAGTP